MQAKVYTGQDAAEKVRQAGGPLAEASVPEERYTHVLLAVVEDDAGQAVAYWPVFLAAHAEPLWITPTARHNPAVGRALLQALSSALTLADAGDTPYVILDADSPHEMAAALGCVRVPGDLYLLPLGGTHGRRSNSDPR